MQNEKKKLPLNTLKNHKKVTSLYLALLCGAVIAAVWPSASNYRLYESLKKMHQWCFDWHLTFPTPTPHLQGGGTTMSWVNDISTIKPYLKTHIFIAQEKMHWIRIQFCPTDVHSSEKKSHFISPIAHNSQFGSFHRQSIFHILLT